MNKYFKMTVISSIFILSGIAQASQKADGAAAQPTELANNIIPSQIFLPTAIVAASCILNPNRSVGDLLWQTATTVALTTAGYAVDETANPNGLKLASSAWSAIVTKAALEDNFNRMPNNSSSCAIQ